MEANQLPHPRKGNCVSVVLITLFKESTNNKYNIIYCLFNARPLGGTTTPLKTSKRIKVSALCNQCSCYAEICLDRGYLTWKSNIKLNTDCTVQCFGLQATVVMM